MGRFSCDEQADGSPAPRMKKIQLKRKKNDLLKKLDHITLSRKEIKSKQGFISEAREIAQMYSQYTRDPNFKYFVNYLVVNLLEGCEPRVIGEVINDLRRIFSRKANEVAASSE